MTAVDFIAAALSPKVLSSVSILVRNVAMVASMAPPPLLVGDLIVLLLQAEPIGHVFVGRNPAAVR